MEILDSFTADDHNTIFAVALEPGFVVDVKVCPKTGLVYVMQNEDGSTVYGQAFSDYTFPDFEYDEEAVIQFVKKNNGLFDEKEKAVPSSLLDQATLKKAYDEILKGKPSLDQKIQSAANFAVSSAEKSSGRKSPEHSAERK